MDRRRPVGWGCSLGRRTRDARRRFRGRDLVCARLMPKKRKKILFVDDEVALLDLLRAMMTGFSGGTWEVLVAEEVSKALAILQTDRIDLLVIDIHMPLVDGVQFLNLLQRKYPNILKVILTGDATDHF